MAIIPDWTVAAAHEIVEDPGDLDAASTAVIIRKHMPFEPDTAYMPVPRCDQCKYWDPGFQSRDGDCHRPEQAGQKFQIIGESNVYLETRPDFGCVQWEQKT